MFRPEGIIASLITNFTSDGNLDEAGLRRNLAFYRETGVKAVCVLGGTGEPLSLTSSERERIMHIAAEECSDRLDLVVGALVGDPVQVAENVKSAAKVNAKACLVTSTPFVRPSERDVEKFFVELGAKTDMPLILFNVPSRSGFLMSAELIARLDKNVKTIVGIKESSRDIVLLSKVRSITSSEFAVVQGVDSLFMASLALGADGGLLAVAAVFPEICTQIYESVQNQDISRARKLHYLLMPLVELMYEASHPAPLKYAVELRGLSAGPTRPPIYGLTEGHMSRIRDCMNTLTKQL